MATPLVEMPGNDLRLRVLCQLEDWRVPAYSGDLACIA
jgi:hypothetical protein